MFRSLDRGKPNAVDALIARDERGGKGRAADPVLLLQTSPPVRTSPGPSLSGQPAMVETARWPRGEVRVRCCFVNRPGPSGGHAPDGRTSAPKRPADPGRPRASRSATGRPGPGLE